MFGWASSARLSGTHGGSRQLSDAGGGVSGVNVKDFSAGGAGRQGRGRLRKGWCGFQDGLWETAVLAPDTPGRRRDGTSDIGEPPSQGRRGR